MVDLEAWAKAAVSILLPLGTLIGVGGRRGRWRKEIRENLALVRDLDQDPILREHTPAAAWLQGKIAVDVARLAGHRLGTPKRPLPVGSMLFSSILGLLFGLLTWYIDRNGFVWYSVFPGVASVLTLVSAWGMTLNRELPPDEDLPAGATPLRSDDRDEQVASQIVLAASGELDDRYGDEGQIGVVFRFVAAMRDGRYEHGLTLAHEDWLMCRVQAWLWNTWPEATGPRALSWKVLSPWRASTNPIPPGRHSSSERAQFRSAWEDMSLGAYGAASRRRRISADCDLVILAPTGSTGGYYVSTATVLPNSMTFVVRKTDSGWRIANHISAAPATPGMPPAWWFPNDPTLEALDQTDPLDGSEKDDSLLPPNGKGAHRESRTHEAEG